MLPCRDGILGSQTAGLLVWPRKFDHALRAGSTAPSRKSKRASTTRTCSLSASTASLLVSSHRRSALAPRRPTSALTAPMPCRLSRASQPAVSFQAPAGALASVALTDSFCPRGFRFDLESALESFGRQTGRRWYRRSRG
jgi:hypothetical protein